jgi:hypothetical protein
MMMVMEEGDRLECSCGALAIIVTGTLDKKPKTYNLLVQVDVWCQACFFEACKAKEEQEDN